jgi:hypothetical protein
MSLKGDIGLPYPFLSLSLISVYHEVSYCAPHHDVGASPQALKQYSEETIDQNL